VRDIHADLPRSIRDLRLSFDKYLDGERGCVEATRRNYQREARGLLLRAFPGRRINWLKLTAEQIAEFVGERARGLSFVSRQNPAVAVRSFLRFPTGQGLIRGGLEGAIPPIGRSKHATLPRHVTPEQLESVLALCPAEELVPYA